MKTAVVTGANGFLGKWLVKELVEHNISIVSIIREKENQAELEENMMPISRNDFKKNQIITIVCPMEKYGLLPNYLSDIKVDTFYHLAWNGLSGEKRRNYKYQLENVYFTCLAVEAAAKMDCNHFVYAGSISEFAALHDCFDNNNNSELNGMYGIAKLAANCMAKTIAREKNITFTNAVLSNLYGPGETSVLINSTIRNIIENTPVSFSSGNQLYDFMYIEDAVSALRVLGNCKKKSANYYIGHSKMRPLKEFILELIQLINPKIPYSFGDIPGMNIEIIQSFIELDKLEQEFGYFPKVSFKDGVVKTKDWIIKSKSFQAI